MQNDEQPLRYFIEEKIPELKSLFDQFGDTIMRSEMDNGIFPTGCQYEDQWIRRHSRILTSVNNNITDIITTLREKLCQQVDNVIIKTIEWKTAQRLALLGRPQEIGHEFHILSKLYEDTEMDVNSLSELINISALTYLELSNRAGLSPVTRQLVMRAINSCQEIQEDIRGMEHTLVQSSFVVFKQPPAIVRHNPRAEANKPRKNSKVLFDLELRQFAGASYGVEVEILLISEKKAQDITNGKLKRFKNKIFLRLDNYCIRRSHYRPGVTRLTEKYRRLFGKCVFNRRKSRMRRTAACFTTFYFAPNHFD